MAQYGQEPAGGASRKLSWQLQLARAEAWTTAHSAQAAWTFLRKNVFSIPAAPLFADFDSWRRLRKDLTSKAVRSSIWLCHNVFPDVAIAALAVRPVQARKEYRTQSRPVFCALPKALFVVGDMQTMWDSRSWEISLQIAPV